MKVTKLIKQMFPAPNMVEAHCDGPCGVYDPASARIAAEAVLSMTKKLSALSDPGLPLEGGLDLAELFLEGPQIVAGLGRRPAREVLDPDTGFLG